jgi:hypothetical protein
MTNAYHDTLKEISLDPIDRAKRRCSLTKTENRARNSRFKNLLNTIHAEIKPLLVAKRSWDNYLNHPNRPIGRPKSKGFNIEGYAVRLAGFSGE